MEQEKEGRRTEGTRNKETRIRRWARSWKSNSAEEDEDAKHSASKKKTRKIEREGTGKERDSKGERNGKFTTGMEEDGRTKEANARFIT